MTSLKKTCPKCLTSRDFETEFYKCKVPACGPCNFSKNSSLLSEWKNRPVVNVMEIE